jgi:hypothetical protein
MNNGKELIENNCEIYINDKKIDFSFIHKFPEERIYTVKF